MAIDGGLGQEILRLRMGVQQPFHLEPQRGVAAAGLVQIVRLLRRRFLLDAVKKIDSTREGLRMASLRSRRGHPQCDESRRNPSTASRISREGAQLRGRGTRRSLAQ